MLAPPLRGPLLRCSREARWASGADVALAGWAGLLSAMAPWKLVRRLADTRSKLLLVEGLRLLNRRALRGDDGGGGVRPSASAGEQAAQLSILGYSL